MIASSSSRSAGSREVGPICPTRSPKGQGPQFSVRSSSQVKTACRARSATEHRPLLDSAQPHFHHSPRRTRHPRLLGNTLSRSSADKQDRAIHHGKQSFRKMRDQAELGHEDMRMARFERFERVDVIANSTSTTTLILRLRHAPLVLAAMRCRLGGHLAGRTAGRPGPAVRGRAVLPGEPRIRWLRNDRITRAKRRA